MNLPVKKILARDGFSGKRRLFHEYLCAFA
jgi:hypothetical protein